MPKAQEKRPPDFDQSDYPHRNPNRNRNHPPLTVSNNSSVVPAETVYPNPDNYPNESPSTLGNNPANFSAVTSATPSRNPNHDRTDPRQTSSDTSVTSSVIPSNAAVVPFEQLQIGNFYNCGITFVAHRPGAQVHGALPKHQVLLSRIIERSHNVQVYYLTTSTGTGNPSSSHNNQAIKKRMYLPFTPLVHPDYIGMESSPPVMKVWCNFADPAVIRYSDQTPSRQLLRYCPESIGSQPPLLHARIALHHSAMLYLRAMTTGWSNTIDLELPIEDWLGVAQCLRGEYSNRMAMPPGHHDQRDSYTTDNWAEEPEWTGIHCVSSPTFLTPLFSF